MNNNEIVGTVKVVRKYCNSSKGLWRKLSILETKSLHRVKLVKWTIYNVHVLLTLLTKFELFPIRLIIFKNVKVIALYYITYDSLSLYLYLLIVSIFLKFLKNS